MVVVLPEPCRPTIIHTDGGREANSGLACLPSRVEQLVAHDLDDLLVGRKLQQHFGAQRLGADVREQLVGHVHVDVAIEQRFADAWRSMPKRNNTTQSPVRQNSDCPIHLHSDQCMDERNHD